MNTAKRALMPNAGAGSEKRAGAARKAVTESEEMSMSSTHNATERQRVHRFAQGMLGMMLATLTGLLLASTPALAAIRYPSAATGSFGEPCSGSPCGDGQFDEPTGMSVNQAPEGTFTQPDAGDVYVIDAGDQRIERFSPTGVYLSQWNGSATPAGNFALTAGPPQEAESDASASANAIAVDSSTDTRDSSAGDVYVADTGHEVVDRFTDEGTYLSQITGTCPTAGTCNASEVIPFGGPIDGISIDARGNLWVYERYVNNPLGAVDEFTATGAFVEKSELTKQGVEPGFAVSP